ncbi:MAG: IPT/TIG domain-containing protein, partial [Candidatus Binataceae bacterium]
MQKLTTLRDRWFSHWTWRIIFIAFLTCASLLTATYAADAQAPTVTSISPNSGGGGQDVLITGTNFVDVTAVRFGALAASYVLVNSPTSITASAPSGSGTVDITVTTPAGTSATSTSDQFTYPLVPTVTSISPNNGPPAGGTTVTITGTNFTPGTAFVYFAGYGVVPTIVNSATSITVTSPAGTGTVDITVSINGETSATSAADKFTYTATGPAVTSISPNSGPTAGGTSVTITGANFTGATAVKFGSTNAASFNVNSATSITATSPAGSGTVDITVTTPGGTSVTSAADQFTYGVAAATPTVTSISPSSGTVGVNVNITGTNFVGVTAVKFGSVSA